MVAYARMDWHKTSAMCNLYSITTNQAAIIALFRVVNRYVGAADAGRVSRLFGCGHP